MTLIKRLTHALILVLTLAIGATAAAIIVTQTTWFKNWLRVYLVREANKYVNGTVTIDRLGGNLFFGVELEKIGVSIDGSEVVAVKDLGLDYNVFQLVTRGLSIDRIRLNEPVIYLRREGDTWSLSRLVKKEAGEADRRGPGRPVSIDHIGVSNGTVVVDGPVGTSGVHVPRRFDRLDANVAFKYEPVRYTVTVSHASFRGSEPLLALNSFSGAISVRDDNLYVENLAVRTAETSLTVDGAVQQYLSKPVFNLQVSSDKLAVEEIAQLVPSLRGIELQPAFEVKANGPLDRLDLDVNVRSSAGSMTGHVVADLAEPGQSIAGNVSVRNLNLAPILKDPQQKSDITADALVNLRGNGLADIDSLRGTVSVKAPRVAAAGYDLQRVNATAQFEGRRMGIDASASGYGASVTTAGHVLLPRDRKDSLSFDVRGRTNGVNLRRFPLAGDVPPADTDVNADYHVTGITRDGSVASLAGNLKFAPSTVAGATIAEGSTVGFAKTSDNGLAFKTNARVADVDLQALGRSFRIPALSEDRFKSSISGHVVAEATARDGNVSNLTTDVRFGRSSIAGASIADGSILAFSKDSDKGIGFNVDATVTGLDIQVVGQRFDISALSDERFESSISGHVVAKGTARTLEEMSATAKIDLQPSTIGGVVIEKMSVDADYHEQTADIRTLEVVGRDVNLKASGTVALGEGRQSNLTLHAESADLSEVGKLVDQPVSGIASLDVAITGDRRELRATGSFTGDGLKYGDNGALAMSSDYTVTIPELHPADATISATTRGTFVTVAGQNINELTAKVEYQGRQVTFDATAKQPQRTLQAAGALTLHPDHQELHLDGLNLQTAGTTWQLAGDARPAIDYGGTAVGVDDLRLVSGDQQISASGKFGAQGESLQVELTNISLANIDALLLRPPQFFGRLNASAAITGAKSSPEVAAEFAVRQGNFQDYYYDSFTGTVSFNGRGVTLDATLQQDAATSLTAKGYVPMALFASTPAPATGSSSADDRFDLHVESSPVDLGLIQGFTTAVVGVSGTAQVKLDVTGTAAAPRPEGTLTVQNAAFTVTQTGVTYTDLDGRIELQNDKIHIDEIRILDNHKSPLSIRGDLAVHGRDVGDVALRITADDFKVIDNKMGNVRVKSDLRVGGELRAPIIEGDLAVTTGALDLDPILAQIGDSAYATKQVEYQPAASDTSSQPPVGFAAVQMDVRLTVPDDLVVKASDLRLPDAPISLGAMTMTLGGDVRIRKNRGDASPNAVGLVRTIRGHYDFQGRRFEILRDGSVRFEGFTPPNPSLDIRTERVIRAVVANVTIRGSLRQPEIVLSSVPPLEQADILSLIVFNQPINQLGEGQQASLAQSAQGLATGAVAGELAKSIGSALNLSEFDINTASDNGGVSLRVGQQVGQDLYIKVEQGIGDNSQTNLVLEYELARWLRLRTNVLQGSSPQQHQLFQRMQGTGVDLLFFFSY